MTSKAVYELLLRSYEQFKFFLSISYSWSKNNVLRCIGPCNPNHDLVQMF